MDLRSAIAKEHSKSQCLKVVDYVGDRPARFKALVEVFLEESTRLSQHAAWPLSICVERHPQLAEPYFDPLLKCALRPGAHPAIKRNVMRIFQFASIPRRTQGKALDVAFRFLQDKKEAIAVRVFSMTVIERLSKDKPEIRRELCLLIEEELPLAGPAFRSRAMKILKNSRAMIVKTSERSFGE